MSASRGTKPISLRSRDNAGDVAGAAKMKAEGIAGLGFKDAAEMTASVAEAPPRTNSQRAPIGRPGRDRDEEVARGDHAGNAHSDGSGNVGGGARSAEVTTVQPLEKSPRQSLVWVTACGLGGALLFVLAMSPLGLGQLAFLVSLPWAWLTVDARRVTPLGYLVLAVCGVLMWLCLLLVESSVATPQSAHAFLQVLLLGLSLPVFVGLGRVGRRQWQVPAYLWLPVVWVSIEYLRGNLFGGFDLGLIAHAVVDSRRVLQLADLVGSYGLSAIMIACGASIAELIWLQIRLRRLERSIPRLVDPKLSDEEVRELTSDSDAPQRQLIFSMSQRAGGRPLVRRNRDSAATSMQSAIRRYRDRTRDNHLVLALFMVIVLVAILLTANQYGGYRVAETRQWKMYEKSLFEVGVVGGPGSREQFGQTIFQDNLLVMTALGHATPLASREQMPRRSKALVIQPDRDDRWTATVYSGRSRKQSDTPESINLYALPPAESSWLPSWLWGSRHRAVMIPSAENSIPIRVCCAKSPTATIERTVRQSLANVPQGSNVVDVAIVVIEPGPWDGSAWPRLLTRSVMSSAVATRTAVIAIVPEVTMAVANGDGQLFCSAADMIKSPASVPARLMQSSKTQNSEELGQPVQSMVRVGAMFDPRTSSTLARGGYFPILCLVLVTLTLLLDGVGRLRAFSSP